MGPKELCLRPKELCFGPEARGFGSKETSFRPKESVVAAAPHGESRRSARPSPGGSAHEFPYPRLANPSSSAATPRPLAPQLRPCRPSVEHAPRGAWLYTGGPPAMPRRERSSEPAEPVKKDLAGQVGRPDADHSFVRWCRSRADLAGRLSPPGRGHRGGLRRWFRPARPAAERTPRNRP